MVSLNSQPIVVESNVNDNNEDKLSLLIGREGQNITKS